MLGLVVLVFTLKSRITHKLNLTPAVCQNIGNGLATHLSGLCSHLIGDTCWHREPPIYRMQHSMTIFTSLGLDLISLFLLPSLLSWDISETFPSL